MVPARSPKTQSIAFGGDDLQVLYLLGDVVSIFLLTLNGNNKSTFISACLSCISISPIQVDRIELKLIIKQIIQLTPGAKRILQKIRPVLQGKGRLEGELYRNIPSFWEIWAANRSGEVAKHPLLPLNISSGEYILENPACSPIQAASVEGVQRSAAICLQSIVSNASRLLWGHSSVEQLISRHKNYALENL